ncbi:MAG: DUF3054 domain-containing protein [Acidimicrobiales bacterium]
MASQVDVRREAITAAIADAVAVLVFVAIGRRSHDEGGNAVAETAKVAAPFLIALVVGWVAARAWRRPRALATGVTIWVCTVAVGMVLRHWVFDRGTAASFVIVATIVTGVFLLGWRAVVGFAARRSAPV